MINNDKELNDAYGWLAGNFDKWVSLQTTTTVGLLSCFEGISGPYNPVTAQSYEDWLLTNRIEIINLYKSLKD